MKTQCPYCQRKFKAPDTYAGKQAKCPSCRQSFVMAAYTPPPILTPEKTEKVKAAAIQKAKNNLVTAAWKKSPQAFKTGFLTTLGVVSAFLVAAYTYRLPFSLPEGSSDLDRYKCILESNGLFSDGMPPFPAVFRGRRLNRLSFVPDANRSIPNLEIWFDEKETVVGIAIAWYADFSGWPADIDTSVSNIETYLLLYNQNYQLSRKVINCFESFTNIKTNVIEKLEFTKINTRGIANHREGKWQFEFTRYPTALRNKPEFVEANKKAVDLPIDEKVWLFAATAQTW